MSIVNSSKTDKATIDDEDRFDSSEFKAKVYKLYTNEFNEILEKILVKSEGDFMRTLVYRVEISLSEKYSDDIFESIPLTTVLRSIEKEIYLTIYKQVSSLSKQLLNDQSQISPPPFSFSKHCKYQSNTILHHCHNGSTSFSFSFNDEYILCRNCSYVYKASCVKLFCDFCSVDYYTNLNSNLTLFADNSNSGISNSSYQPATWEKYHCNIVYNDQMKCIECKQKLMLDALNNKLICLNCGFNSDPFDILWRCMVCFGEFKSNAKIYNPLEYQMIKNTIKDALIEKDYAKPTIFPCNHDKSVLKMNHKTDCDGILYVGSYNEAKMIICSKCNIVTLYEKYIWTCPICNKRFREKDRDNDNDKDKDKDKDKGKFNEKSLLTSSLNCEDNDVNSLNSSTNDSGNVIEKKFSIIVSSEDQSSSSSSSLTSEKRRDNNNTNTNTNYNFSKVNITSMPKLLLTKNIRKIDLMDLTVISEIAEGTSFKVYAVRNKSNQFYALKKQSYNKEAITNCIVQYSIKFNGIIPIKGININETSNELHVLEELGICDLDKEIISRRRIKKYYTEIELLNMIYQLSLSLAYLQLNGYAHCNICTNNVILFKDGKVKISGFSSLKKKKENKDIELIKSDAFDLGLTLLYTSTFMEQSIDDVISVSQSNPGDVNKANDKIKEIVEESLLKSGKYSERYIELVLSLLNSDENKRFDFFTVNSYIATHFGSN